jgi:uncharacterized membrane protein
VTTTRDHGLELATIPGPACPRLGRVVARTAGSVATAVVIPAALLSATVLLLNVTAALIVALAWMVGVMCWRWVTGRAVSWLLVLTLGILTVKTGFTLVTGNTFVYFVQPVFTDAAVATVFLGSLWTGPPIVARLASDFYPINAEIAARPRIRRLFRSLTLMWGLVVGVKGVVTLWLLQSLPMVHFMVIKSGAIITLTGLAAAGTVVQSAIVGRREGLFGPPVATRR